MLSFNVNLQTKSQRKEADMIWHEIVKYSPKNYDDNGVYIKDEGQAEATSVQFMTVSPLLLKSTWMSSNDMLM